VEGFTPTEFYVPQRVSRCQRFIVLGGADGLTGTKIRDAEDDTEPARYARSGWQTDGIVSMFE